MKDWLSQAKDITSDVSSSDKYQSIALRAEVKLAEAFERCTRVCPTSWTPAGEEKPNKLKTAVCCQVGGSSAVREPSSACQHGSACITTT